jgi:hypothetical protein
MLIASSSARPAVLLVLLFACSAWVGCGSNDPIAGSDGHWSVGSGGQVAGSSVGGQGASSAGAGCGGSCARSDAGRDGARDDAAHGGTSSGDSGATLSGGAPGSSGAGSGGGAAAGAGGSSAGGSGGRSGEGGGTPSGGSLSTQGTSFVAGGNAVVLRGVNDPVVFPLGMFSGDSQRYKNQEVFGSINANDPTTNSITAGCVEEFWYRLFYLLKHNYNMNVLRAGGQDSWGLDTIHRYWRNNRDSFKRVLLAAVSGAALNDSYLLFEFGGCADGASAAGIKSFDKSTGEYRAVGSSGNLMQGHLFQVGSEAYNHYLDYIADVMGMLAGKPGVAAIEILNEPDSDVMVNAYWQPTFGGAQARAQAYVQWVNSITCDLASRNHQVMISMGHALEGSMWDEDWYTGNWCKAPNASSCSDFSQYHKYFTLSGGLGNSSDASKGYFYYYKIREYLSSIHKPFWMSEWGYSGPDSWGLYNDYRQEYEDYLDTAGFPAATTMRLAGHPSFPLDPASTPLPSLPGGCPSP